MPQDKLISIILPVQNEEKNIPLVYKEISKVITKLPYRFEFIFINDGSRDKSLDTLQKLRKKDPSVTIIDFTRNFGKEIATTAGINNCKGDACIILDADLQHPPKLIPQFIKKWEKGSDIVIGIRKTNKNEGKVKMIGSFVFYKIMNQISGNSITPRATDFMLIDRQAIDEFNKFSERNRLTRGLVEWLGFDKEFIYYNARERIHGKAAYSITKLIRLAINSIVSLTYFPLKLVGYFGSIITILSAVVGIILFVEEYILHDKFHWYINGTAILATMIIFLVGIILMSLGLITLYIANIHVEAIKRPLYIIKKRS